MLRAPVHYRILNPVRLPCVGLRYQVRGESAHAGVGASSGSAPVEGTIIDHNSRAGERYMRERHAYARRLNILMYLLMVVPPICYLPYYYWGARPKLWQGWRDPYAVSESARVSHSRLEAKGCSAGSTANEADGHASEGGDHTGERTSRAPTPLWLRHGSGPDATAQWPTGTAGKGRLN